MANVLFIKGNTATINSTAIADGQLLWNTVTGEIWEDVGTSRIPCGKLVDTSLNPISPNAVSNQAITGSIVNELSTARATNTDYVPCGAKVIKQLMTLYQFTLDTTGWTLDGTIYKKSVTFEGITTSDKLGSCVVSAGIPPTSAELANSANYLYALATATNTITFCCRAVPSTAVTVQVEVKGSL